MPEYRTEEQEERPLQAELLAERLMRWANDFAQGIAKPGVGLVALLRDAANEIIRANGEAARLREEVARLRELLGKAINPDDPRGEFHE